MSSAQTSGVALGHGPAQPRVHSSTITVHTGLAPVHCRFARPSASTATSWVNIAISAAFRRPTEASQDNAFIAEVRIQSDPAYGHWRRQLSPQGRRSVFGPHGHPAAGPHYRLQTAAAIPGGRPNTCGGVPGFVGSRHRRDLPSSGKPVRTVLVGPMRIGPRSHRDQPGRRANRTRPTRENLGPPEAIRQMAGGVSRRDGTRI